MNSCLHGIYLSLFGVFFCIGLPCWLVGCNPNVPEGCITRELINMTYTGKTLETGVCCVWGCSYTVCSTSCGEKSGCQTTCNPVYYCCGYNYGCYSCRYNFHGASNATQGDHCTRECGQTYSTQDAAMSPANSLYSPNQDVTMAYDPRTDACDVKTASINTWKAGVSFLVLSAFTLLLYGFHCLVTRDWNQCAQAAVVHSSPPSAVNNNNSPPPAAVVELGKVRKELETKAEAGQQKVGSDPISSVEIASTFTSSASAPSSTVVIPLYEVSHPRSDSQLSDNVL